VNHDRARGALVGVAVGDALGAAFEGYPGPVPDQLLQSHLAATSPLRYTDDTALTIAVAESLLASRGLDEDHLAATLAASFAADPHRGYGAGAAALLSAVAVGEDWRELAPAQFGGAGSFGNGAAMRSAPYALVANANPTRAAELARRGARTTHTHPIGVEGAAVLAAAVALALGDDPVGAISHALPMLTSARELSAHLWAVADLPRDAGAFTVASTTGTGVSAADSVPAAVAAFCAHPDSFPDAVRFAVSLGGDTDTIAAMTGALAGARHGYSSIPPAWVTRTEGVPHLVELADHLIEVVAPRSGSVSHDAR
jgi:poly(ADP-ribose) glycohydrolase ARH3